MAMCVMYMVGRTGAAVGSNFLGATLDLHCQEAFAAFGVFTAGKTCLTCFCFFGGALDRARGLVSISNGEELARLWYLKT